jgi:hypothetical protein
MSFIPGMFPAGAIAAASPATAFTFFNSSSSTGSSTVVLPTGIQAGDVIVLLDSKGSVFTSPALVVPAGFTQIATVTGTDGSIGLRNTMSFKIADGSEGGATITGMAGNVTPQMLVVVFRPDRRVLAIALGDVETVFDNGNPASRVISASAGTPPLILVAGYNAAAAIDPRTFTPAKDGEAANATTQYIAWKFYNKGSSPADHTIDMDDESSSNCMITAYLQAT